MKAEAAPSGKGGRVASQGGGAGALHPPRKRRLTVRAFFASPLAKRITAPSKGIDLSGTVSSSHIRRASSRSDVENAKPGCGQYRRRCVQLQLATAPALRRCSPFTRCAFALSCTTFLCRKHRTTNMRKAIAKRLTFGQDADPALLPDGGLQSRCADGGAREDECDDPKGKDKVPAYKLSVNDFHHEGLGLALMGAGSRMPVFGPIPRSCVTRMPMWRPLWRSNFG